MAWLDFLCMSESHVYSTDIDVEWLTVCNDVQVGSSRIDFLYEGRDALEVKTPLSPFPLERIGNPYLLHVSSLAGPVLLVCHSLQSAMLKHAQGASQATIISLEACMFCCCL